MSQRAKDISERIESFRDDVVAFVEILSDDDWKRVCAWEEWSVGVTACHLGAGHFGMSGMLCMIVKGEELPQLTMDQVNEMSKKSVQKHTDCTKTEALELLRKNGSELAAYVSGLTDDELDRKGSMPAFGGEVSAEKFIDYIIFQSATQHFDSMKTAVGR
jgi:DinB superfamily